MTDLTIFVPTFGRPMNARQVQEAFNKTCRSRTEIIFVLSKDDSALTTYLDLKALGGIAKVLIVNPERRGMTDPLNMGFQTWFNNPRIFPSFAVGFMGDDHRPRTVGWDTAYLEALTLQAGRSRQRRNPGVGMVYGNDLLQGESLPTQIAMTTNIPATLGYMVPESLMHLYTDNYWLELGKSLGKLQYLPDVVVEHMHPGAGKAVVDAGYEFSGNRDRHLADKYSFESFVKPVVIPQDVAQIKRLM